MFPSESLMIPSKSLMFPTRSLSDSSGITKKAFTTHVCLNTDFYVISFL